MRSFEEQANAGHGKEVQMAFTSRIPLGSYISNEECAAIAVFLFSDAASGCNGDTFLMDSG